MQVAFHRKRVSLLYYYFFSSLAYSSISISTSAVTTKTTNTAIEKWRLIPSSTTKFEEYRQHDENLYKFLSESVPEALPHTGDSSFDSHLRGVQSVLRGWEAPDYLADAGLFHSLYGTEGFQGYKLSLARRPSIRALIGPKAERLVWIFCMVDRFSVDKTVMEYCSAIPSSEQNDLNKSFTSREELGRFNIPLRDNEEWLDFLELSLADWLEQVEGSATKENPLFGWQVGEAWQYRRHAYARMADILAEKRKRICKDTWLEVYSREDEATRSLHQIRTPPMSIAAREAREALESISL